jgi:hypothetical protein
MWIGRLYAEKVMALQAQRPVVLLTGIRQVGKSSLLKKLFPIAEYVTLDYTLLAEEAASNPLYFLQKFEGQVIIDEMQYAPTLFRNLKILVDQHREKKGKWILTGSQQFSLMDGVRESLAGRAGILNLYPLSAVELNEAKLLEENARDLLWKGGFPEIWAENLDAALFYQDYIQTYLERDLKLVLNVTNIRDFRRFMSLLALRAGQLLNLSSVAKDLSVTVNTVKAWVNALETSGIIYLLPPYYNNLGKRLIKAPKLYVCDNGLLSALLNIESMASYDRSLHRGALWENFTFTELLKAGFVPGKSLFYYRDQNGVEIDFVVEQSSSEITLLEAKETENPSAKQLNFKKVAPLFKEQVRCVVASNIWQAGFLKLKDFEAFNPLMTPFVKDTGHS